MIINYEITGNCGKNVKNTILYSPKRIINSFLQSYRLHGAPSGKNIYNSLKTLIKTPNVLKDYNPHYASIKTNCILALCNDVLAKEYNANIFSYLRFGTSKSIPNTYFATDRNGIVTYSICLKQGSLTASSIRAAKGGFVAQLKYNKNGYWLLLTDPVGNIDVNVEMILEKERENRAKIIKSIIADKNHKTKEINGSKIYYLTFESEDVSFEYGLAETVYEGIDDDKLSENGLFENGVYINVLKFLI